MCYHTNSAASVVLYIVHCKPVLGEPAHGLMDFYLNNVCTIEDYTHRTKSSVSLN